MQLSPKVGCTIIIVVLFFMWAFSGSGEKIDPTMHMSDPDFKEQEWSMLLADKKTDNGRYFSMWLNDQDNQVELESDKADWDRLVKGVVYEKKAGTSDLKALSEQPIAEGNSSYGYYDSGHAWHWHQPYYRSYMGYHGLVIGWHPHRYHSYWRYGRPWHSHFGARWNYRVHHRGWGGYRTTFRYRSGRTFGRSRFGGGGYRSGSSFRTGGSSSRSWGGGFRGGK